MMSLPNFQSLTDARRIGLPCSLAVEAAGPGHARPPLWHFLPALEEHSVCIDQAEKMQNSHGLPAGNCKLCYVKLLR